MPMVFSPEQHKALRKTWSQESVTQLLKAQWKTNNAAVVTVESNMMIEQAFDVLVKHNINAAPIFNSELKKYIGMVSMPDVLEYVVTLVRANKAVWQEMDAEFVDQEQGPAIAEIVSRIRKVKEIPVSYISDLSHRDPFISLPKSANLEQAMDIFSKGIHRIVITDDANSNVLLGILSQSDMIRFLVEREREQPFQDILKMRLNELNLTEPKEIVHVKAFQAVIDALQAMHSNRVSSVAVVDATDRLLGNISASDVKHIMRHLRYGILYETCSQFINKVKTRQMLENAGKDIVPVIQVSPNATLHQVLRLLIVTQVHRVWCTEQNPQLPNFQSPITVISLTDILRVMM